MSTGRGRRGRWVLAGLAVALLGAVGLVLTRVGPLAPLRVSVATVETASVTPALFGLGTVEARQRDQASAASVSVLTCTATVVDKSWP